MSARVSAVIPIPADEKMRRRSPTPEHIVNTDDTQFDGTEERPTAPMTDS